MQLFVSGDEVYGYCVFNAKGEAISRPFASVLDAIGELNRVYGVPGLWRSGSKSPPTQFSPYPADGGGVTR